MNSQDLQKASIYNFAYEKHEVGQQTSNFFFIFFVFFRKKYAKFNFCTYANFHALPAALLRTPVTNDRLITDQLQTDTQNVEQNRATSVSK